MAIEIIDGTLVPTQARRIKRGYGIFAPIKITTADGTVRTFDKVATGEPVTSQVAQGGQGRFYLARFDGAMALIGVRRPDGSSYYAHPHNMIPIVLTIGALGTLCAIARFGFGYSDMPLLAAVLGPPLLAAGFYLKNQKDVARRTFQADAASYS